MSHRLDAQGRQRSTLDDLFDNGQAGDWYIDEAEGNVWLMLPHLTMYDEIEVEPLRWPYRTPLKNGACWQYNGNPAAPTLKPSLNWVGMWHGWLTDGKLKHV